MGKSMCKSIGRKRKLLCPILVDNLSKVQYVEVKSVP